MSAVEIIDEDRVGECADPWYKRIQPAETVELQLPSNLPTCLQKRLMGLLFYDVHIDKGTTLNLLQCLRVICGCRAIHTNSASAETTLALGAAYVALS